MKGMVSFLLFVSYIVWAMDIVNDCTIAKAIKKILSPVGEWICNLLEHSEPKNDNMDPFVVSEYFARIEKANLEILEDLEPIEQIVVLWWGLDGLRLNEDGTSRWISRKKPSPVTQNVFYQPCQTMIPTLQYDMCQSTRAQIDDLIAQNTMLKLQSAQAAQNMMIANSLAGMIQTPVTYPLYHYAGCCCNFLG